MPTEATTDGENTFKRRVFIHLSWVTIVPLCLMAIYYVRIGATLPALLDAGCAGGLLLNTLLFGRHRRLRVAIRIGVGLGASSVIGISILEMGLGNGSYLWFFTLPAVSIYLLGKKEGSFWTLFYFCILFLAAIHQEASSTTFQIRFLLAYLVVAGFTYSYEHLVVETTSHLEAANLRLAQITNNLSRYLSPQICAEIVACDGTTGVNASRKHLTFFFSDIVDFTATTDHLEPETLTGLLNSYLDEMSQIVLKHGGTIDKYIGDAIVAFFGDPHSRGRREDALACVRMALEMRKRMGELREQWQSEGISETFHIRMGINSGFATVGNFGADRHMNYTVIGSQVNLAARLESKAEPDQILVSESTRRLVREEIFCKKVGELSMKGIGFPVPAYQVVGAWEEIGQDSGPIQHRGEGFFLEVEPARLGEATRARTIRLLEETIRLLE